MAQDIQRTQRLRKTVEILASDIGERNLYRYGSLGAAAGFIENAFGELGYSVVRQIYEAKDLEFSNLEAEIPGQEVPQEIVIVGAHYDTHRKSPGANDNGSAIAALLELARACAGKRFSRTLRFIAFTNEESPFTRSPEMGSRVYARRCRKRGEEVVAMICLETIGFCSDQRGSQWLSLMGLLLPRQGNFIALVGNSKSHKLLSDMESLLHHHANIPCKALTLPTNFPGAWSSDHWSFWKEGYPAVMVTDTAPLRYRQYHTPEDTPEKINYDFLTKVVDGLEQTVRNLAVQ
ncbi:M28 family peptidase [Nitrosomonas sp. Nm166]|uniref:M28 family peptidase n=1 Tax=Nitrosomonas sp. Nm166 TaxID=1881054 RepID=UPI0008EC7925|nr:M28 family peptidase [Nitrosomonas sp. Nm166]SFE95941.1 Zn-dependent amino-or carboxypeptidase, M28 family [Nitrosomonas sp. Nm166]